MNDEITDNPISTYKIRNFKYLDDLIRSGLKEIVLDSILFLSGDEESQYRKGIKLDVDDLVIDGNGHAIDARSRTRMVGIWKYSEKNLNVKGCTFKDNKPDDVY